MLSSFFWVSCLSSYLPCVLSPHHVIKAQSPCWTQGFWYTWFSFMTQWPLSTGISVPTADKVFPGKSQCFPGLQDTDCWQVHNVHQTHHFACLRSGRWVTSSSPGDLEPWIFPAWVQKGMAWGMQGRISQGLFFRDPAKALMTEISLNNKWGGNC
jgi:hypothetical protein